MILICHFIRFHFVEPRFILFWHVSHNRSKIIKVKGTISLHCFFIFIWFSHGRNVLCADIILSDTWLGAVVCESNIMITMTNNLLCILPDVGDIQIYVGKHGSIM